MVNDLNKVFSSYLSKKYLAKNGRHRIRSIRLINPLTEEKGRVVQLGRERGRKTVYRVLPALSQVRSSGEEFQGFASFLSVEGSYQACCVAED